MNSAPATRLRLRCPAVAVWRSSGVLQIGLDSPALVLEGVPRGLAEALALLARPSSPEELVRLLPGLGRAWVDWLIARLAAAGLLVPATAAPGRQVAVVGGGALAEAVAADIAACGLTAQRLDAAACAGDGADAPADTELVVLAGSTAEPDRSLTEALLRSGIAHLVARLEPDRAVVGPLVLPGRTSCVRCHDLSRCRLDAAWPNLLAQLCREQVEPDPGLLAWAATTAATQARAWLAGELPETCGSSLELGLADFRLRSRTWPAHPGCGCLAPVG